MEEENLLYITHVSVKMDLARLEELVFTADHIFDKARESWGNTEKYHEKILLAADTALTSLQCHLTMGIPQEERVFARPMLIDCLSRLQQLRIHASQTRHVLSTTCSI